MKSTTSTQYNVKYQNHVIGFVTSVDATLTELKKADSFTVNASDDLADFLSGDAESFEAAKTGESLYVSHGDKFLGYFNSKYEVLPERLASIWKNVTIAPNAPKA